MNEIAVGVGTGGSATERAVGWAAKRASGSGSRLRLVHVVDEASSEPAEFRARECLDEAAAVATAVDAGLEVVTTLERGSPIDVFERISADAEMLVVGSDWHEGRRASRRRVLSLRIAAVSRAAVAVIPDRDPGERRGIVVGVDGSHISDHALSFAADEADRAGESLIAVHSWDVVAMVGGEYGYGAPLIAADDLARAESEILDAALAPVAAAHPGLDVRRTVVAGDPVHDLTEAASEARMLVVGSHGRGALARFLLGSVSQGVLADLVTPTIVVR
ncbi:nucleotide-binding universal stress UspA family protein [Agromyces hippuratus]|uniref:Nucleotide-binding universal stress UspA family protein n=1 Tax=Agromyces hippuratus TaxID=286438 RepID=A0A852WWN4_9MICO|nr:universal stress protein [Agromyces hippuratus]NYG20660.1 nucleotide-binding universal stress UspA family protein [Agromyces hippuratus]